MGSGNEHADSPVEYAGINKDFTPAYMDYKTGEFNYGSWKDTWLTQICRPCMMKATGVDYYLDPNDLSKKLDGSPSDYNNPEYDGPGVFVEIDQVWIKEVEEGDTDWGMDEGRTGCVHVYLSPTQQEGFECLSHTDEDGNICKHIYRGKYLAVYNEAGCKSLSGLQPGVEGNYDTGINQYASCTKWGKGWQCEDWSFLKLMQYLHLLLGCSTETKKTFGSVIPQTSGTNNTFTTGENDTKGQFYGGTDYAVSNPLVQNRTVTTFYMDSMWGDQSRLLAGYYTRGDNFIDVQDDTRYYTYTYPMVVSYTLLGKMHPPYVIADNPDIVDDLESADYSCFGGFYGQGEMLCWRNGSYSDSYSCEDSYSPFSYIIEERFVDKFGFVPVFPDYNCYYSSFIPNEVAVMATAGTVDVVRVGGAGWYNGSGLFAINYFYDRDHLELSRSASTKDATFGFVPMLKLASATTPND